MIINSFDNFSIGTFEPEHEIWNFFLTKRILLKHYENANQKKYSLHATGSAKSRIYARKSTKRGFSKKAIKRIKFFCCFRFLWISWRPGMLNWKQLVFLVSKILYKQYVELLLDSIIDKPDCAWWQFFGNYNNLIIEKAPLFNVSTSLVIQGKFSANNFEKCWD